MSKSDISNTNKHACENCIIYTVSCVQHQHKTCSTQCGSPFVKILYNLVSIAAMQAVHQRYSVARRNLLHFMDFKYARQQRMESHLLQRIVTGYMAITGSV